jgi:hypothetical protein
MVGPRAPVDKVSRKRRREHREGGSDAPDEVAAVRAHLSRGSTCGGRVEVARRCPTVAEVLRSRRLQWRGPTAPEERGEGEAHATCEPQRTEDPAHRRGGGRKVDADGGEAMGDGMDMLGGGAGRQRRVEWMKKKNGEKGSKVGGQRLGAGGSASEWGSAAWGTDRWAAATVPGGGTG